MTKRLLLLLAPLTAAAALPTAGAPAAPSSSSKPTIGIAEQLPNVFTDSRYLALHIPHARIDLAWDVLHDPG